MRRNFVFLGFVLLLLIAFSAFMTSCTKADDGKIKLTTTSEDARAKYLVARELIENLRIQEARPILEEAVRIDPNFAMAHLLLSNTATTTDAYLSSLNKAVELVPQVSEGEASVILATEARTLNDPMTELKHLNKLVMDFPTDERAHNLLAVHYYLQKEYRMAIDELNEATRINPNFAPAYNMLGYARMGIQQYPDAEIAFKKYIELIPNDPNPYDSYAELLMKMGRFEESIKTYRTALRISPDFLSSYAGIASNLNYLGRYEDARKELRQMYEVATNNGQRLNALFATSVSYLDEGNVPMAIQTMQDGLGIVENDQDHFQAAQILSGIGIIQIENGRAKDAAMNFERSLQMVENTQLPTELKEEIRRQNLYNMARVAIFNNDITVAQELANQYRLETERTRIGAEEEQANQLDGLIALQERRYEVAVKKLEQGDMEDAFTLYCLAQAYEKTGEREKAMKMCQDATILHTVTDFNYALVRGKAEAMLAGF
jgi:tetratricopeptide (TPR) repeat protein